MATCVEEFSAELMAIVGQCSTVREYFPSPQDRDGSLDEIEVALSFVRAMPEDERVSFFSSCMIRISESLFRRLFAGREVVIDRSSYWDELAVYYRWVSICCSVQNPTRSVGPSVVTLEGGAT